jgi:hypothetical protein
MGKSHNLVKISQSFPKTYMTSPHPPNPPSSISPSNNPFIWGNIALLAGVPWLIALSMAGLAVGDPVFPEWFEIFLLGFPAIALVTWVQWQQPISPFSLWLVAKPSESLSDQERQILTLVKQHSNGWYVTGWIATAVALVMSAIFCKIYISAPLAQAIAPFPAGLRLFGILWAEICFLLSNILLQAGISALRIKLTAESDFQGLQPFALEKIKNSFTSIGWQSPQILKFFEEDVAIAQVSDESPKGEAAEPSPDVKESQEAPDAKAIEPSNFVTEVTSEAVSDIDALTEDSVSSEPEAIAEVTEEVIADPLEFAEDADAEIDAFVEDTVTVSEPETIITENLITDPTDVVENPEILESLQSLEPTEIISESEIETTLHEEIIQEVEEPEPIEFLVSPEVETLDITDTSTNTEVADVITGNDFFEEVEELEISAIVAEESLTEAISETDSEQFIEEIQAETSLTEEQLSQTEKLEFAEIVEEIKNEKFLDIADPASEHESETVLEVADVSLDEQLIEEDEESSTETISESEIEQFVEEPQIETIEEIKNEQFLDITDPASEHESATVLEVADVSLDEQLIEEDEESSTETISEPEIEQFVEEPQIETILNQEIDQETEELNPFELVEDEKSDIGAVLNAAENEPSLHEEIDEESEELEFFEIPKEPELTFLEIPDAILESEIEGAEHAETNLEISDDILEEESAENGNELESLETIESSEAKEVSSTAQTSDSKRSLDFLKKPRKIGGAQKKQGFGKPIKRDIVSSQDAEEHNESISAIEQDAIAYPVMEIESDLEFPDTISEQEMIAELIEETNLEAIATTIEQDVESIEIKTPDFDDELDELIAFNAYVENILREYLEDNDQESKNEEPLDQASPEEVDPSIVFDPATEEIAKDPVEYLAGNSPDAETQVPADVTEDISSNEPPPQNTEYLVQELLVDKFLARIEELNIADKANRAANEQTTENISKPDAEIDEFADLEALLDRKLENPDTKE